jgi:hypothetical protein
MSTDSSTRKGARAKLLDLIPEAQRTPVLVSLMDEILNEVRTEVYVEAYRAGIRDAAVMVAEHTGSNMDSNAKMLRRVVDALEGDGAEIDPLCRCDHPKSEHQGPEGLGGSQCRSCTEDGERSWRHPFILQEA